MRTGSLVTLAPTGIVTPTDPLKSAWRFDPGASRGSAHRLSNERAPDPERL